MGDYQEPAEPLPNPLPNGEGPGQPSTGSCRLTVQPVMTTRQVVTHLDKQAEWSKRRSAKCEGMDA